ncbi:MAG TPA: DUF3108 domain-containing protein [Chthoniobacterales bacterium]|nr:DUF3108 domain-containing protein [Chthoniobacterales bacterium]
MRMIGRTTLLVTILLVVGFAECTFAQPKDKPEIQASKVNVGDSTVTGANLKPCTNLWKMTQRKPDGPSAVVGTWSDALENLTADGRPAMKRTQIAKYDKKKIELRFVSIFDPKTMEPFSFDYSRSDNGNVRHVEFRHENVIYRHTDSTGSKPEEATVKLDQPVFDFYGGMYGLLISSLPLADGYTAEIPTFDTNKMAIDWVPVRVKGRETVDAGPGKKAQTWVVETATKLYGRMTWWVTKEPPYVIKAVLKVPETEDGSGKIATIITYTMV